MRYMVMECHLSYAVVMDENGDFLKAANMHYEVGQIVDSIIEMNTECVKSPAKKNRRLIYSLAAAAACFMITLTSIISIGQMPYGYVYLNINPSVKIDVNRKDMVVGLEGLNSDGEALIDDYTYKKKNLETVTDELVDKAADMGYLHSGGTVTLTIDSDDNEWITDHSEALSVSLNSHLEGKLSVTIIVSDTASQTFESIIPVEATDDIGDEDDIAVNVNDEESMDSTTVSDTPSTPVYADDDDDDDDDD